ncbi:hypothetical protein [Saccharothrix luteola]|uniref:hypothetical protein n=1 Tax=Saccharothrix luteola TaxID=2893018 RepID=UPI0035568707
MTTAKNTDQGIWRTFVESPAAVKAVLAGVFVNKVGGFLNIFLVLFLTARGFSAGQAATALGVYGVGNVIGVLVGGALADRLGARNSTVLSMGGAAVRTPPQLYQPDTPQHPPGSAGGGGGAPPPRCSTCRTTRCSSPRWPCSARSPRSTGPRRPPCCPSSRPTTGRSWSSPCTGSA